MLQAQTLTNETPSIGKITQFSKIAITVEPMMQFSKMCNIVFLITGSSTSNRLSLAAP